MTATLATKEALPIDLAALSQHVDMLTSAARDHGGVFMVVSFKEGAEPKVLAVPNNGQASAAIVRRAQLWANEPGRNVHLAAALMREDLEPGKKGGEADVRKVFALVVDFDDADATNYGKRLPVPPDYVVETSPGRFQCTYVLGEPVDATTAKTTLVALIGASRADPSGGDASKVWRLAGLPNWPNKKKRLAGREPCIAKVAKAWNGGRTSLLDIQRQLQDKAAATPAAPAVPVVPAPPAPSADGRKEPLPISDATLAHLWRSDDGSMDRSAAAWAIVKQYKRSGHSKEAVLAEFDARPQSGAAERYAGNRARLAKDIGRMWGKPDTWLPATEVFEPIADAAPTKRTGLFYELFHEIEPVLTKRALVDRLLDHAAMSVLYGDSNTGKSFIALDLLYHVAANLPWFGWSVDQGAGVYIAAEGGDAIRKRFAALRKHYGAEKVPMALIPCPVDLSGNGADVQPLLDQLAKIQIETGRIVLLVIDTLARAMAGANENAFEDMSAFIRNVDRLRAATGAHVLVVHHSGKIANKGARGHSSLRAATDTELEIADRKITVSKQRDMEIGRPIGFDLRQVVIGKDANGQPVASCVVVGRDLAAEEAFAGQKVAAGTHASAALSALENLTLANPGEPVTRSAWRAEFMRLEFPDDPNGSTARGEFSRAQRQLSGKGRIVVEGDHVRAAL